MTGRASAVGGAVRDVGACLVGYFGLRLAGVDERWSLLGAAVLAGVLLGWDAVRRGRVTWFAAVMLVVFGVGFVWTLLSGDPRILLLKDTALGVGLGAVFLLSVALGRPLTLSAAQTSRPDRAEALETLYRDRADVRRRIVVSAVVWGVVLPVVAVLRVPLVVALPVDVMVVLGEVVQWGTLGLLAAWNLAYTYPMWRELDAEPVGG